MTIHELKVWPEFFEPLLQGLKTFELRSELDRNFQVGDILQLQEYNEGQDMYTGRSVGREVSHIVRHADFAAVPDGYAMLSFAPRPIDMLLYCPACGLQHVDAPEDLPMAMPGSAAEGSAGWTDPTHRSHLCRPQDGGCSHIWRPADVATNGVATIKTKGGADSPVIVPLRMPVLNVTPPASSRDRWMYQQGVLAARDPRTAEIRKEVPPRIPDGIYILEKRLDTSEITHCSDYYLMSDGVVRALSAEEVAAHTRPTQAGALQAVTDEQIIAMSERDEFWKPLEGYDGSRHEIDAVAFARAILALAATQPNAAPGDGQGVVPEGWKLVPIKMTEGMLIAASEDYNHDLVQNVWATLLSAAPSTATAAQVEPPAGEVERLRAAANEALLALEVYMKLPADRWPGPPTTATQKLRAVLAAPGTFTAAREQEDKS